MNLWPPPQRVSTSSVTTTAIESEPVVGDDSIPAQGYRITLSEDAILIDAADEAGARYAQITMSQLRDEYGDALPVGTIEDWPAIGVRSVMLDVSRAKVPSVATMKQLFARFASWKLNQVVLYLEHTFAYKNHEDVWATSSAYTAEEIRELDDFADSVGIELVGQQNCLGHMERWLKHERYRPLAISPDGFVAPWGQELPASTADPDNPATLVLARELFGELLPLLRSRTAHVGLDEPWELSSDRSGSWIDYLKALRTAPELADHHLYVWDDVLVNHPELLAEIPDNITICHWGYEAAEPFDERAAQLKEIGLPFLLCAGTSAWNTVAGRWTNATTNISSAATAALATGADGLMVTDWGDQGHVQQLVVSEPMFAWMAGNAWNPKFCSVDALPSVVDRFVFHDAGGAMGEAMRLLGDVHTLVTPQVFNSSILCVPMYRPQSKFGHGRMTSGITITELQNCAASIATARALIESARIDRPDAVLVRDEALATATLLALIVDNGMQRAAGDGTLTDVDAGLLAEFDERLDAIMAEHERIWLLRNRPGGLDESLAVIDRLRSSFVAS